MRHVAAYLLAVIGGNQNPTEKDLKAIMNSVGIEPEPKQLKIVIDQLKGKNILELVEEGQSLLADMNLGGGGGGAAAPVEAAAVEEVKEEKKPVVEESESDSDMGMGLFD
jgi:large subunit ribosomal protein LP2